MRDIPIFVPVVKGNKSELYRVKSFHTTNNDFFINYPDEDSIQKNPGIKKLKEKILTVFNNEIDAQVKIKSQLDEKTKLRIDNNKESITLGVLCSLKELKENYQIKDKWGSITVTGNIDVKASTCLKTVSGISQKFLAVRNYARMHSDEKHTFIYVSNNKYSLGEYEKNITVYHFDENDNLEYIFAEIFDPQFTEEQKILLGENIFARKTRFVETVFFEKIKRNALKVNWNGYFLKAGSETGKTSLTYALCQYLMQIGKVYAPIWISFSSNNFRKDENNFLNDSFNNQKVNKRHEILDSKFRNPQIQENSNVKEIQSIICRTLKIQNNIDTLKENIRSNKYVFIFDNIASNDFEKYFNSFIELIKLLEVVPYILITGKEFLLRDEYQNSCKLTNINIEKLTLYDVENIWLAQLKKNNKINIWEEETPEDRTAFLKVLHRNYAEYPGLIVSTANKLNYYSLHEIYNQIVEATNIPANRRIIHNMENTLVEIDFIDRLVLYAFVELNNGTRVIDYDEIYELIEDKIFYGKRFYSIAQIKRSFSNLIDLQLIKIDTEGKYSISELLEKTLYFPSTKQQDLITTRDSIISPVHKCEMDIVYNKITDFRRDIGHIKTPSTIFGFMVAFSRNTEFLVSFTKKMIGSLETLKKCIESPAYILSCENIIFFNFIMDNELYSNINSINNSGDTALLIACKIKDSLDIVKRLIQCGADFKINNANKQSPLMIAASNNNIEVVNYLLDEHLYTEINETDIFHRTVLMASARNSSSIESIERLIHLGADYTIKDENNYTVLMASAQNMEQIILDYFLDNNLYDDINACDNSRCNVLYYASCSAKNTIIIKRLINKGACYFSNDINFIDSFMGAITNKNQEIFDFYFEKGLYRELNTKFQNNASLLEIITQWSVNEYYLEKILSTYNSIEGADLLHSAALNTDNINILKYILTNHLYSDINRIGKSGTTALWYAAAKNNTEAVRLLIKAGANYNIKETMYSESAIQASLLNENEEVFHYFIDNNLYDDINYADSQGWTLLSYAAEYAVSPEAIAKIISKGADYKLSDEDGLLPFMHSFNNTNPNILKYFLKKHLYEDINKIIVYNNTKDNKPIGFTPLQVAALTVKNIKFLELLLEYGADYRIKGTSGFTLLMASIGNEDIFNYVMELKLYENINDTDVHNQTALTYACAKAKTVNIIRRLIDQGAVDVTKNNDLLLNAIINPNTPEILNYILKNKLYQDINKRGKMGFTPLMFASGSGLFPEIIEELINNGADTKVLLENGRSFLFLAATNKNITILKYILEKNLYKDIDETDNGGMTPLLLTALVGEAVDSIRLLLDYGADYKITTNRNSTLLHLAAWNIKNPDILKFIIDNKLYSNIDEIEDSGATPLCDAVRFGSSIRNVELLIKAGADYKKKFDWGCSLLLLSILNDNVEITLEIINEGKLYSDINENNNDYKRTAINYAGEVCKTPKVIEALINKGADISLNAKDNVSLLHASVFNKNFSVFSYIVENRLFKDIDEETDYGMTALMFAARNGTKKHMDILVHNGANASKREKKYGRNLLMLATFNNIKVFNYVLDNHLFSDINDIDFEGKTVLHYVAGDKDINKYKKLLNYGADENIKDANGMTPKDLLEK